MHRRFLTNAGRGTGDRRILTKDLLRTGTWWVLKSRNAVRLCDPPVPNTSPASTSDLNPAFYQAYFDLMRASWILYNYLLSDPDNTVNMSDEDIKSFSTLQDAIDEDFEMFRNSKISVGEIEELNSGARIWEATQPSEGAGCEQEQNPWPDPARWLTIEESHAGSDGERSHLRIFVNAELGARNVRVRTRDARYVLILWTEEGQSELKITLCNQSGTLGISRDSMSPPLGCPLKFRATLTEQQVTPEDIGPLLEEEGESNAPPAVDIKFSEMEATIHFLHISDYRLTLRVISVLKRYEHLHPNTNRPLNPNEAFHSISLRVYETTGEEGWMTTRRLVLSSSAGARQPWCLSYFLPLSNVEVKGDGALQLIVRWSDCGQKILDTDGAFNKVFSYVYDERSPNRCLGLGFGSAVDADSFEEAVLKLSLREKYRWDSTQESRYVYSIRSTSNNAEKFKGLLIRHRSPERKYSEMFYLPRDLDFELENGLGLRLLKVYCTNYVSNHVARLYDVEPGTQSKFSHCERRIRSVDLLFGSEADAQNLLRNLTDKWELNFVRYSSPNSLHSPSVLMILSQIARVSHKPTGQRPFFRMASSSSCSPAHLSLWQRGDVQRLVIRRSSSSSSPSAELYLTAVLDHDFEHDSEKMVVQRNIDITKGGLVDIATMEAVGGRRGSGSAVDAGLVKEGQTLTIEFRTFRGGMTEREAFVDVSQLSLL
ncbi:hypothetical protein C7212DRAFT_365719 [Tuber magnatum]|uniref:Uncharacterized protein n=1 Tax=Tuber magnatum TaxID=42249 RepID=A0A317SK64_9PEZI|nr:hypothetical protein C7212DRAFT_365719 [Tuber magnatum]